MTSTLTINFWKLLIMIVVFTSGGLIFQKTEYYLFTSQLGYLEANETKYEEWYSNPDLRDKCKKKHLFNIPVGIILAASVLVVFEYFKKNNIGFILKADHPRPSSLREYSNYYYAKGFNIVPIQGDYEGNNVTRDSFKSPKGDWAEHKFIRQSKSFVESIDWKDTTGIGAIAGINNLICIDIDDCKEYKIVNILLKSLGLSDKYPWIICSGSGNGFHIWLKSKSHIPSSFPFFDEPVIKFHPRSQFSDIFKQIEIRMSDHVVLPPSINSQGGIYEFKYLIPDIGPTELEILNIINTVSQYGIAE